MYVSQNAKKPFEIYQFKQEHESINIFSNEISRMNPQRLGTCSHENVPFIENTFYQKCLLTEENRA